MDNEGAATAGANGLNKLAELLVTIQLSKRRAFNADPVLDSNRDADDVLPWL